MPDEEKHEGIATKIRERIKSKEPSQQKEKTVHESLPQHISEKIHERYENYKAERKEKAEHRDELKKTQREAYRKEEIHQASESGRKAAQKRYAPRERTQTRHVAGQAQKFAKGASTGLGAGLFGSGKSGYYDMSFGGYGGAPKKKPTPQRITRVSKSGTVTITEPVQEEKKKPKPETWNSLDLLTVPEFHTAHSTNPFNLEITQPHTPHKGKGHKRKMPKRKWQIGDLL